MLNLDQKPFTWLPIQKGSLLDMTAEYTIMLLHNLDEQYKKITALSRKLTEDLRILDIIRSSQELFSLIDSFLDNYSKLVKSVKLSLGEDVGEAKSQHIIFSRFSYTPDTRLQQTIVHGIRNTAQHFEERLQGHYKAINPFAYIHYEGGSVRWSLTFGSGGYSASNYIDEAVQPEFSIDDLFFESYEGRRAPTPVRINIQEVWQDIVKMKDLLEANLNSVIETEGICCPPPRGISITMVTNNGV